MASYPLTAFEYPRDVVLVEGADARTYLQSQLTQDVEALNVGGSTWSFILDPKSNIEAFVRVTRIGHDRLALDIEPGFGDVVRNRLDGRLFRTDARFSQFQWPGVAWRGDGAATMKHDAPIVSLSPWSNVDGLDLVGPNVSVPTGAAVGTEVEFEVLRIAAGWPRMASELGEGITPAMTGLVDRTVSFEKGCYTGQELVARTYHRGAAPTKRLVRVTATGGDISHGDTIVVAGEPVGEVTSMSSSGIGLAFLARKIEVPTEASIDEVEIELTALD